MKDYELTIDQNGVTHLDAVHPQGEFTACGWAFDNCEDYFPVGDGTKVDCPECLRVIAFYKKLPNRLLEVNR